MEFRKITALKTQNGPKPRDSQADDKFQGKLLYPTAPAESSLNAFPSSPFSPPQILICKPRIGKDTGDSVSGMVRYSDR